MTIKPKILFISDLYYKARLGDYYREDIFLTGALRDLFNLVICHPKDTQAFETNCDAIVFRNAGPVIHYKKEYHAMRKRLLVCGYPVYNSLTGRGDMLGKQYMLEMMHENLPIIPTVAHKDHLHKLPDSDQYVVKPKDGGDSIGLRIVDKNQLQDLSFDNVLVQPKIDFRYEMSFYFIDRDFQYALHAPKTSKRWQLVEFHPSTEDLNFARQFVEWNPLAYGIQRVDACRTQQGDLLLLELEDLNPYLSLLDISKSQRDSFMRNFRLSLQRHLMKQPSAVIC